MVVGCPRGANVVKWLGGARKTNEAAAAAIEKILATGTRVSKNTKAYGEVIEYRLPSGLGVRFSATDNSLIGFLGRGL